MSRFLIPIGGNEKKSPNSEIFRQMVELAGGTKARIVVVPTASDTPSERARDYQDVFSAFHPESLQTLHIGERTDAGSAELTKIIGETTLFMFAGGDQLRLSSLIGGTPLHRTLLARYRSGGCVVAGTSAGATVIAVGHTRMMTESHLLATTKRSQGLGSSATVEPPVKCGIEPALGLQVPVARRIA